MADFRLGYMLRELWKSGPGRVGLVMMAILVLTSIAVVIAYPIDFGSSRWGNPLVWANNPKSAPPVWQNFVRRANLPRHFEAILDEPTEMEVTPRATRRVYRFTYEFTASSAPTFVAFTLSDVVYSARPPVVTWSLSGPDGRSIALERFTVNGPRRSEAAPFERYEEPRRSVVGSDGRVVDDLQRFFSESTYGAIDASSISENLEPAMFGVPNIDGTYDRLLGEYTFEAQVLASGAGDTIGSVGIVVGGGVFGIMGTDALGRDLAEGLLFGLPVALLIGISTATVSTILGMSLGMISGYSGGWIDLLIQRAADIVANIPVLPLLIFLVFIVGSKLWLILLVLVAFSWPGLTIMVRTMVLQLRTGAEVEATRALGARDSRIIVHHILPHSASYVLAQLVFFAPSAILAEAGLSFLGLGDPSIPTWGQILEYGFRTGAVFLGYWWWVIPPGVLIIITAVTFMFLALGLEPVVDPRLRGKRSWHF